MTDKIMIDGVNVSECLYRELWNAAYGKKYNHCKRFPNGCCSKNKNCYYKQLKRKEKECEIFRKANDEKNEFLQSIGISAGGERKRIKYYIDKLKELNKSLQSELQAEKERNEKLKTELCSFMNGDYCANGCGKMKNQFVEVHEMIATQCEKYKQALEEIKEIASGPLYAGTNYDILKKCEVLDDV